MPKSQNEADGDDEPTASKRSRMTPGTSSTTENPPASTGLKNTLHGNVFQLKLLMLFLLRGIGSGFSFHLGTENPGMGGKFDDLIFKFKKSDQTSESYRFLQAKHKQNEEKKITAADLLNENDGEFSLPKYFRSYCRDIIKGTEGIPLESIEDCIICTNIGFDSDGELRKKGIELIRLVDYDQILIFNKLSSNKKSPTRYKLRKTDQLRKIMAGWSDVHRLAKTMLIDYVTMGKQLALSSLFLKSYHVALVDENVIDKKEGKLCTTFLEGDNSRFREILSELTFVHYFEKLKLKRGDKKTSNKKLTDFDETSLRKQLPKYPQSKPQTMELNFDIFEDFYVDLIDENLIEREGGTSKNVSFNGNLLHGINLSPKGLEFRGKLRNAVFIHYWKDLTIQLSGSFGINSKKDENKSLNDLVGDKEIGDFLDKLVFAVHTPNEVELDDILKNEVGKYYNLHENDFQSDFILRKMLDWFKEKESKFMSSGEGKNIFKEGKKKLKSLRVTAISIDYQNQLKEVLEFNEKAIEEMKEKLKQLLTAEKRIGRIATSLPKRTAVKVIAALEMLRLEKQITHNTRMLQEYFQYEDSYLMTSSSRLQKDESSKFKKIFESEYSHNLLLVVCEVGLSAENDDEFFQNLVKKMLNKRIIIISQDGAEVEDKLKFGDLNEKSKRALLEKQIDFQGTLKSVGDLIKRGDTTLDDLIENGDPEEVIDCNSIEELIKTNTIKIPACTSARFEPELYVERQLEFPWENSFYDELAEKMKCTTDELQKECTVDSQGCIHWLNVEDSRKKEIWTQMKIIVGKKGKSSNSDIAEENLIDNKESRKGQAFIISGLAGTGKSTILSNYYEIIKRDNPDIWAIRIDLVDCSRVLAEFNFSLVNQSSAVCFFANIFAKDSPFARSLLTHRFRTDGRIVVMLDGFDEIDDKLHEKVFQLIKAVKLTKMDALYITTRSHLKGKIQDQIFQFSYNFKNFSQEDQVDCLSKYWGNKLNMLQTQDGSIQLFAESLVERLTTTLSDRESDFIGIPLQCRMLAECFESQLQDTIQKGLPIESLIESISENDLDLASLYSLFMKKKLEIYRKEKFKADPHHYQANTLIDRTITYLEDYLRKLAIKTIVSYPNHINVLLGESNSLQSKEEKFKKKKVCNSDGVCFGFLDKTDKGKVKFLHRTYAEYLFAKYLYAGFLPEDEKNCNNLLTSKSARKVICMKILGRASYDCSGVRVFFNSMLKERAQPQDNIPFQIEKYSYVLINAIEETNSNIFLFMCDCLDMKFSKEETGKFLHNILCNDRDDPFSYMYRHKSKVFERFMSYYDSNNADDIWMILWRLVEFVSCLNTKANKEKTLKFVSVVFDFLDQSQGGFLQISQKEFEKSYFENVCYIFKFLFSNKYYDSPLKKILKFLSSTLNIQFENCLVKSLSLIKCRSQETLDYILENLRIFEEENKEKGILKGIFHHILIMNSQLFKSIYQREEEEGVFLPTNIQSFLVRDSRGMTRLHRAALRDDEATVDQILETVRTSYSSSETEAKNLGKEVLHNVIASEEKGVTPLYVAAACEHENIFQEMLNFLKGMLSQDERRKYLTDTNGFLGDALWDAIKWEKIEMFQLVLESVKNIFGQDDLIALLKAANKKYESGNVFSACHAFMFYKMVFKVIVNDGNGYSNLYDLLFQNWESIEHLQRIDDETFQTMLSLNGLDDFLKRILDTNLWKGMHFVVCQILDKFTDEQRVQLCRILIKEDSDGKSFFNRWWLDPPQYHLKTSKEILQCISDNLGQSVVNELLFNNEHEVIKRAFCFHDEYVEKLAKLVDFMLSFLSNEKEEVIHHMMAIVLQLIEKITETSDQEGKNYHNNATRNILEFVFKRIKDCVKESDLSKFVDLITNRASIESKEINIWIDFLVEKGNLCIDSVDKFLKCVKDKLGPGVRGQSAVEELVRKEDITQVLTTDRFKLLEMLLGHLPKEKREKIELEVIKNAPTTLKTLIGMKPKNGVHFWTNILRLHYVTKYADRDVLLELMKIISQHFIESPPSGKIRGGQLINIWIYYFEHEMDSAVDVEEFLKCVSEKLGQSVVDKFVEENARVFTQVLTRNDLGNTVNALLRYLSKEKREEIELEVIKNALATLKTLIDTKPEKVKHFLNNILHLQYVTKYADRDVLQQLVKIITQPYKPYPDSDDETTSIWITYLHVARFYQDRPEKVDKFLLCVSDKLGKNKVKKLVLHGSHSDGARYTVISTAASYGEKDLVEAMLAHLTEEDRQEIQRDHVDPAFKSDAESQTSNYCTYEEIAFSSDSIDDSSDEAVSNRK